MKVSVFFFLATCWSCLAADEYVVRNWTTAHGLPDNIVRGITQTADGYIWVGTDGGVARFDGVQFEQFTTQDTPELGSNVVWDMLADRHGALWIATQKGLSRYQDGQFEFIPLGKELLFGAVWRIVETSEGHVWFLGDDGLRRWQQDKIVEVIPPDEETIGDLQEMAPGPDGEVWLATNTGLWRMQDETFESILPSSERIDSVAMDTSGRVWMVTKNRTLSFLKEGNVTEIPVPGNPRIHMMRAMPNGDVWLGAQTETRVFRLRGPHLKELNEEDGFHGSRPICFFTADDGAVWIGLNRGGLYRLQERRIEVFHREEGLVSGFISSIAEDINGNIYTSLMGGGLFRLHAGRGEKIDLQHKFFSTESLTSIAGTPGGGLWVGELKDQIYRFDQGQVLESIGTNAGTRSLLIDRSNHLWRGTSTAGLEHFAGKTHIRYDVSHGMTGNRITCLAEDRDGAIWAGTDQGLNRIHHGRVTPFRKKDGLNHEFVRALFVDSSGHLWVGTDSGGLLLYDGQDFSSITTLNGLPGNSITQILEDESKRLWLGTKVGLFRVALTELHSVIAGEFGVLHGTLVGNNEGLIGPQFGSAFHPSCLRGSDGLLWFGGNNGVIKLDPKLFDSPDQAPKTYINSVRLDGAPNLVSLQSPGEIHITPEHERVEISFTAINFNAPEQIRFRCRLKGYEDWVNIGTRRSMSYVRVPPGHYEFQVKAANNDGVWFETGASIQLHFQPAFWQTIWFRILTGVIGISSLVLLVRAIFLRNIRQKLREVEQREALEAERTRISRDMHDELGANLTRIKLLSERIELQSEESADVIEGARRISKTARDLSLGMDEIVWAINPDKDKLESFTYYLTASAEESLRDSPMRLRLNFPEDPPELNLSTHLRHNLLLATKEALHNSIKHSHASEIELGLRIDKKHIRITVTDNGIGFRNNGSKREGNGLRNMKTRLEGIGGECTVLAGNDQGVQVIFTAPI